VPGSLPVSKPFEEWPWSKLWRYLSKGDVLELGHWNFSGADPEGPLLVFVLTWIVWCLEPLGQPLFFRSRLIGGFFFSLPRLLARPPVSNGSPTSVQPIRCSIFPKLRPAPLLYSGFFSARFSFFTNVLLEVVQLGVCCAGFPALLARAGAATRAPLRVFQSPIRRRDLLAETPIQRPVRRASLFAGKKRQKVSLHQASSLPWL